MFKNINSAKKILCSILPFLILSITPWIIYFNTLNNDFVFDDLPLIQGNETLPSLNTITDIISIFTQEGGYRPIRALSYAIDYHFSELNPLSYHISNITYHIISALLVYLITLLLLGHRVTAFFTALLFAVHPVHTDSVTYIAGRRDVLFALFYLTGFYAFLKHRQTHQFTFILLSMTAYLLSIGSKEMGVTLPAIFLIYDLVNDLPQESKELKPTLVKALLSALKKIWTRYKYFYSIFFMGALAFSYYKVFISSPSHQKGYYGDSLLTTLLTTGKIIIHYIKLLIFPINLVADYSYDAFPLVSSFFEWPVFLSLILLLSIFLIIVRTLLRNKWAVFGGIWFFVTLLPVCQIVPHHELLAEHYLYLPSYGFCLIVALFLTALLENKRRSPLIFSIFIAIIVLFSLRILDRNKDWKDGMTLWGKTVRTVPRCARAQNNLGVEYLNIERHKEAITHLKKALKIKPEYPEVYNNLGLAYREQGLNIPWFSKMALMCKNRNLEAFNNLANTFALKGEYDRAIRIFNKILGRNPNHVQSHNNLGIIYQQTGQFELAKEHFSKALLLDPNDLEAHNNLGIWYKNKGMYDKAIEEFKQVLILKPDFPEVHCNLGAVYNNKGWYDHAINEFKEALRLKPHFTDAMNNLGNAYRGIGWYDQAIDTFKKALAINPDLAITHLNLAIIYLYQKKDVKKALHHFERVLEIKPDFSQAEAINNKIEELKMEVPLA
ncbi:MAG: tetratricopeptide repeat protein [Deltaproteobacteria bacterium]|nr:tetratricopeptide repeat protein [Deltaproteobacteria bacterium]